LTIAGKRIQSLNKKLFMSIALTVACRILPVLTCAFSSGAIAQVSDSIKAVTITSSEKSGSKAMTPEIFTNGFIDIMNNGQINASARFIRLLIGEPGKLTIPLSLYSGVSANNFQILPTMQRSNDHLVTAFINPLTGLINLSVDGVIFFDQKKNLTRTGLLYHVGERLLTGYVSGSPTDPRTGRPVNFLNSFFTTGGYFQTGAWERSDDRNLGIFWLAFRYHFCYTRPVQLREFLPGIQTNGIYTGYSFAFGVEINNLVNLKAIYYKYYKKPELDYTIPIYQFSFNYSLRS
jgi:hypothetical protein